MALSKMLAFLAFACVASVAQGSLFSDNMPSAIAQQRSLLQAVATPAYYSPKPSPTPSPKPSPKPSPRPTPKPKSVRISATVRLLIRTARRQTLTYKYGASYLVANLKAVTRFYNKLYKANNNVAVGYKAGPIKFTGQAWVTYTIAADIGPAGAKYSAGMRLALQQAVRKTTCPKLRVYKPRACVRVVRGNFA